MVQNTTLINTIKLHMSEDSPQNAEEGEEEEDVFPKQ